MKSISGLIIRSNGHSDNTNVIVNGVLLPVTKVAFKASASNLPTVEIAFYPGLKDREQSNPDPFKNLVIDNTTTRTKIIWNGELLEGIRDVSFKCAQGGKAYLSLKVWDSAYQTLREKIGNVPWVAFEVLPEEAKDYVKSIALHS